jgi:hypothetical protein
LAVKKTIDAHGKGVGAVGAPTASETPAKAVLAKTPTAPTTSLAIFELCVQRAKNLVKLHEAAHGRAGKPQSYTSDAHRAAIVLAVSALDAFVRDFVISRTRVFLVAKNTPLPSAMSAQIRKFLQQEDLLEAARKDDLLERVEKAFRSDFEKRSFQGTKNIEDCFKLIGYEDIFHDLAIDAGMNEDTLRSDLNRFTLRRHAIAHRGDYDLDQNPPKEKIITKKDAEDCIKLVCKVAKQMHELGAKA